MDVLLHVYCDVMNADKPNISLTIRESYKLQFMYSEVQCRISILEFKETIHIRNKIKEKNENKRNKDVYCIFPTYISMFTFQ